MKRRLFAILLVITMLLNLNATAFAHSATETTLYADTVQPRGSFGGYGHRVTGTGSGTFEVVVSGSSMSAGVTISTTCSSPNSWINFSIEKPDGSTFINNITLRGTEEKKYNIIFPKSGTYKIHYQSYTTSDNIHIQCWIYG